MRAIRPRLALLAAAGAACAPRAAPPPEPPVDPPASAYLALLPDGEEKRRFVLDCTGCHVLDARIAFPEGRARSRAGWEAAVTRMLGFAGASSGFPVISAEREPAATAAWLARHLAEPPARGPRPAPSPAGVVEFAYPYPQDLPHDLAVDADGGVVITGMMTHRMLRLDPATGAYAETPIPVERANPRALEIDPEGRWWVLLGAPRKLARFTPATGEWRTYDLGAYAHESRLDARGRAWFNGHFSRDPEVIGYADAATGEVRTFRVPAHPDAARTGPVPYGLAIAPDGSVWGTELHGNRIFRFDPEAEAFRTWTLPAPHSGPRRPAFDARGRLWIPEYAANRLAVFDLAEERFAEYPLPLPDALPYVVAVDDARERVWIGTGAADAVLRFDPATERFAVHPLPTRGALVRHVAVDPATGDLWAAYGASPGIPPKIARIRVPPGG